MIEETFVSLALLGTVVAAVTDLRSRMIPNRLTLSLVATGIFGYFAYGVLTGDISLFLASLKSLVVMFVLGYALWMLGAWSAGDAKEFLFIAALIPVYPTFLYGTFEPIIANYPFVITVFVNTFLSILPFIFVYSLYISLERKLAARFMNPLKNPGKYFERSFIVVAAISVSYMIIDINRSFGIWILTPLALLLFYRIRRERRIALSAVAIFAYVFPQDQFYSRIAFVSFYFVIILLISILISLLLNSINIVRKEALVEEIKITDLKEGTIIAEEIYIRDGEILRDNRGMIEKIKDSAKSRSYQTLLQRKGIVSTGAAGITDEEVERLKEFVKRGKLEDRVNVKKSMPFAPVILIGIAVSLVIGDAMLALKMWLYG